MHILPLGPMTASISPGFTKPLTSCRMVFCLHDILTPLKTSSRGRKSLRGTPWLKELHPNLKMYGKSINKYNVKNTTTKTHYHKVLFQHNLKGNVINCCPNCMCCLYYSGLSTSLIWNLVLLIHKNDFSNSFHLHLHFYCCQNK